MSRGACLPCFCCCCWCCWCCCCCCRCFCLLCSYWSGWLSSFSSVWLVWPIESEAPKPTTRLPTRCQRTMSTTTTISTGWQVRLFGLAEKPRSLIILPAFPSSSGLTAYWHMIFYQNSLRLRGAHSGPIWGPRRWRRRSLALCGSMWHYGHYCHSLCCFGSFVLATAEHSMQIMQNENYTEINNKQQRAI